jgi:SAM-dependent methyltransferase
MNEPKEAAFWDERYSGDAYAFGMAPNVFLAAQAHLLAPGLRAFVPGDGEGRNGVWLAERGLLVDSVDASPLGVAKARALAAVRGVHLNTEVADLRSWNWPRDSYDIVAALFVHLFDEDRERLHPAMLDALKPGGVLILEAFSLAQLELQKEYHSGGPKTAKLLYSIAKLSSDFAAAEVIHMEETRVRLDEGHRHSGPAAVVRAIVRKRLRGDQ